MKKIVITLLLMQLAVSNLFAQEITPGQEVDLGLPSGTIWAGWNVGASSPEEYGGYYAWGETEEKSDYAYDTYMYYNSQTGWYTNIGSDISGTQYDVARQKWGGSWRMPTKADFDELLSECTWTWYRYKGVNGYKVTSSNGNSIFLPAAGELYSTSSGLGGSGGYWSASLNEGDYGYNVWDLYFDDGYCYCSSDYGYRFLGRTVRPVK